MFENWIRICMKRMLNFFENWVHVEFLCMSRGCFMLGYDEILCEQGSFSKDGMCYYSVCDGRRAVESHDGYGRFGGISGR